MKRFLLIPLILILLVIASCKKDQSPFKEDNKLYDISYAVSLFKYEVGPIGSVASGKISSTRINGAISAATGNVDPSDPESGVDYIHYFVYKDDKFVKTIAQTRSTPGFGKIIDQLAKGSYTITVLAAKKPLALDEHNREKVLLFDLPGQDVFHTTFTFEVDGTLNRLIYLRRATALMKLITDDVIPLAVTRIEVSLLHEGPYGEEPVSNYMRLRNGEAGQFSGELPGESMSILVTSPQYGKPFETSAYVYGLSTEYPRIRVKVDAYNSANQLIYSGGAAGVEMENGKQTTLKGALFNNILLDGGIIKLPNKDWEIKGTVDF